MALTDLEGHIQRLRGLVSEPREALRTLFEPGQPILVARAPGRLDVMGGIADYSGSLVLEMPIAEAALVAVQESREMGVDVISLAQGDDFRRFTLPGPLWIALMRSDYASSQQILREDPQSAWVAYVLGAVLVLMRETPARLRGGLRILVDSRVPEGKGVSSSAAVEVATMRAVAALAEVELPGDELARLCQVAENHVVGAPCGIMDQMTSALGRQDQLLALLCQPAEVEGYVEIPKGLAFWGIDSGIRHAVSGSDYASVRTGAFMGYRIIADTTGLHARAASDPPGVYDVDDPIWHGYLANISPDEFRERFTEVVPREMAGRDFLARYGGTTDRVTRVSPTKTYAVRRPTFHPIAENDRVRRFRGLLTGEVSEADLIEMGELMYLSHESYSACGLGSDGTDLLVRLVRDRGPVAGLYGAKITGGGSGGTVAVLGRAEAAPVIQEIAHEYTECCGRTAYLFRGSSPGACETDVAEVVI